MIKYVDFKKFEYLQMDTDSAYIAISGMSLLDIIKPEMRERFIKSLKDLCHITDITTWFPQTYCDKHINHDKRPPGLFKVEFKDEEMIGLCSKTMWLLQVVRLSSVTKVSIRELFLIH